MVVVEAKNGATCAEPMDLTRAMSGLLMTGKPAPVGFQPQRLKRLAASEEPTHESD